MESQTLHVVAVPCSLSFCDPDDAISDATSINYRQVKCWLDVNRFNTTAFLKLCPLLRVAMADTDHQHDKSDSNDHLIRSTDNQHPANLIPELCRKFWTLGWVTGTGGGTSIRDE
jgi:hypothetical protein